MPLLAIALLLLSAALHATWNFLLKRSDDKFIAMGWQVLLSGACALLLIGFTGPPPPSLWRFTAVSVLLEAVYFAGLCAAYRDHDFSLIYPIARGAAPVFLAVGSAVFLHERLRGGGYAGLALIVGGMIVIGGSAERPAEGRRWPLRGLLAALGVAGLIALYTLVDGTAVKRGPALSYGLSIFVLLPGVTVPWIARRQGWPAFRGAWRKQWRRLCLAGALGLASYLSALLAYALAPLTYAGAIREFSVVLGALLGWQLLHERMGATRLAGSLLVGAGVLAIALFG